MHTNFTPSRRPRRIGSATRTRQSIAGVMLIEVLVSILIFSFGILGTVALYARAVQYSGNAEDRSRAALLANEMTAAMWLRGSNNRFVGPLQGDYDAWVLRVQDGTGVGLPGGSGVVSARDANGTATITITWTPPVGGGAAQQFVTQVTM